MAAKAPDESSLVSKPFKADVRSAATQLLRCVPDLQATPMVNAMAGFKAPSISPMQWLRFHMDSLDLSTQRCRFLECGFAFYSCVAATLQGQSSAKRHTSSQGRGRNSGPWLDPCATHS